MLGFGVMTKARPGIPLVFDVIRVLEQRDLMSPISGGGAEQSANRVDIASGTKQI